VDFRFRMIPIYLALDVSKGVAPYADSLQTILDLAFSSPLVEDNFAIGLVRFSRSAQIVAPLGHIAQLTMPETFRGEESVDLSPVFRLVQSSIESDILRARQTNTSVYRPTLFLVVSQWPKKEDWHHAYQALMSQRWPPEIVVVDIGHCPMQPLQDIATRAVYRASDHAAVGLLIADYIADAFRSRSGSDHRLRLATHIQGIKMLWTADGLA